MRQQLMFAVLFAASALAAQAGVPPPRAMVPYVDTATIVPPSPPANTVGVIASGHAMTTGWSDFIVTFQCGVGGCVPMTGIVEARMVGLPPTGMVGQAPTKFQSIPIGYGRITPNLKGFHICGQSNCITLMLDGTVIGGTGGAKTGGPVSVQQ